MVGRFPTRVILLPLLSTINRSVGKLIFCLLQLNPAMIVGESPKLCDIHKSVGLDVTALNYRDELTLHESVNTVESRFLHSCDDNEKIKQRESDLEFNTVTLIHFIDCTCESKHTALRHDPVPLKES